jgi:plastocyanin
VRAESTIAAAPTASAPATAPAPGAHSSSDTAPAKNPAAAPASTAPAIDSGYVTYDAATKTVTFRLMAGPFQFNGFGNGGATLTVPPGSTNVWNFEQGDGTPHSAEVASGSGPIPNSGGDPAIPRAYTNKVVEGLPQGATDVIRFTAPDTGTYRIVCGVPGHALSGMWIWLKIDPAAKAPGFGPTKP